MSFAITLRFPVARTFPSEVEIPGSLYLHVSAFSPTAYPTHAMVAVEGVSQLGEVMQSARTQRPADTFKYRVTNG